MWSIKWCHFQWLWMTRLLTKISRSRHYLTLNLRNGTRQRHSYNGILIEILKGGIRMTLSHLKWLSEICNDTEHERSLCDSWATCHHLIWVRPQPFQCTTGTIPPLFLHGVGHFPLPPPPSANRQSTISTVNVYKIDKLGSGIWVNVSFLKKFPASRAG